MGDGEFSVGRAEAFVDVPGGNGLLDGARVGHADIFGGEAGDASGDEQGVFAAEHPCQPAEGGIGSEPRMD
ncbi:hypothetical protein MMF96_08080 [Arthrobacter sp. STN4]|nr:hypothetical protein [Arthrobacter sp. STN4]MCQ9164014.1 hypothetical protein [Arthrobacter sp. STN4]